MKKFSPHMRKRLSERYGLHPTQSQALLFLKHLKSQWSENSTDIVMLRHQNAGVFEISVPRAWFSLLSANGQVGPEDKTPVRIVVNKKHWEVITALPLSDTRPLSERQPKDGA